MAVEIIGFLLILIGVIICFIRETFPVELTALCGVTLLVLFNYLTPSEALSGLSSPTVVTLACMFVLASALRETGAVDRATNFVFRLTGGSDRGCVAAVVVIAIIFSAFMNNVAAVALLIPGVLGLAQRAQKSPSLLLIPLSFGALLGGMTTIIGTPPNLLAAHALEDRGVASFGFVQFSMVGGLIAVMGALVIIFLGPRLLPRTVAPPQLRGRDDLPKLYRLYERVFSVRVPLGSASAGSTLRSLHLGSVLGAQVIAIVRGGKHKLAPRGDDVVEGGDVLVIAGRCQDLESIRQGAGGRVAKHGAIAALPDVQLISEDVGAEFESLEVGVVEAVISPRSSLFGRTLREIQFRERYGFQVLAVWRGSEAISENVAELDLRFGDALLLQGPRAKVTLLQSDRDFVVLEGRAMGPQRTGASALSVSAFLGMAILSITGILPIEIAALLAVCLVLLFRVLPVAQVYREIEWRLVLFVAALLPFGVAMQKSGTAALVAELLMGVSADSGAWVVFAIFIFAASCLSQLLDSAPSLVFLAPVIFDVAQVAEINVQLLMMATAFSASFAFLTPFSHKGHLLVMNAGGYTTRDYLRLGVLVTVAAVVALVVGLLVIPAI